MPDFDTYADRYSRARLRRQDGVLEVTLHDGNGRSLVWDAPAHRELPELFSDISRDPGNRVVILTGAGDVFCTSVDRDSFPPNEERGALDHDVIYTEGRYMLENLLKIEVPVIGVANGPATIHAELLVLSDVVLAADDAVFADSAHYRRAVPGDGVHTVWPALLGPNRGRYFVMLNQHLSAAEALELGVVGEVHSRGPLLARAREVAADLASVDSLTMKYTRIVLTEQLKRTVLTDLGYGLALECLAKMRR